MALIQITNLSFTYEGSYDPVFEKVTLQLDTAWRLGLIGRNGRGKTTLLRLLLGELPHEGHISTPMPFSYFPYEVENTGEITEIILEALCPGCEAWEILREVSLLDVPEEALSRPFQTLSNGEQTKVLLAALFLGEARFLLIDEPTNHLDAAARETIAAYLRRKAGFILVSHDRALLEACTDHTLSLNKSGIELIGGSYETWEENRLRQDQFEAAEQEKRRREAARLEEAAGRNTRWSDQVEKSKKGTRAGGLRPDRGYIGHKSAKMMKRAKVIEARQEKAIEEAKGLLLNLERKEDLKLFPLSHHARTLVNLMDFTLSYGEEPLFRPLRLAVEGGDRVALLGKNGSGKSSLLKLLAGEPIAYRGSLTMASQLKLSVVRQDASDLSGSLDDLIRSLEIDETQCKTILRKLGFSRVQFEKDMAEYSDGQKKKVLLAGSLCQSAHLYLWDEPLNFIDIPSRLQIEALILEYKPTLIVVEHDAAFCQKIATKTLELKGP